MKQTAVEYLYKNYLENPLSNNDIIYNIKVFAKAKELEKQQIVTAFIDGDSTDCTQEQDALLYALEYYNKVFTKPTRIANDNINVTNK